MDFSRGRLHFHIGLLYIQVSKQKQNTKTLYMSRDGHDYNHVTAFMYSTLQSISAEKDD